MLLLTVEIIKSFEVYELLLFLFLFRSASLDVEPLYTFRCHTGPVLCLAMSSTGEQCYSGGLDGRIYCWNLPNPNIDPYDSFGKFN